MAARSPQSAPVIGRIGRRMQRHQVISERRVRAPQPQVQSPDLGHPPLDAALRGVYLTVEQARLYTAHPTHWAFRKWVDRHGVRKCHAGRRLRFRRVDLDRALAPAYERDTKAAR
jgi:hypothetical protein